MKASTAFKRALVEVTLESFADIPSREEDIVLEPSAEFSRKSERLLRRAERRTWKFINTAGKRAILIAVLLMLLAMTAMAVPPVRRAVLGLIAHDRGDYYQFTTDAPAPPDATRELKTFYLPTYLPDGFRRQDYACHFAGVMAIWVNADDRPIFYYQAPLPKKDTVGGISATDATIETIELDDLEVTRIENKEFITYVWLKENNMFELMCTKMITESEMQKIFYSISAFDPTEE